MEPARRGGYGKLMKPHLLIVEDEDALTTLLEYHLEKEGYRTSRAAE